MKSVALVVVLILFFMAPLLFAEDVKNAISEKEFFQVFSGTWVNEDYLGASDQRQKIINYSDGRWEEYNLITDDEYYHHGKYIMDDMWVDSNDDIWYQARSECLVHDTKYFVLGKISNFDTVWENVWSGVDYPSEVSLIGGNYRIYYRQE